MKRAYYFYLVTSLLIAVGILATFLVLTEKKINIERISVYEKLLGDVVETAKLEVNDKIKDTEISLNNFLKYDNSSIDKLIDNLKKHDETIQRDYLEVYIITDDYQAYNCNEILQWKDRNLDEEEIVFIQRDGIDYVASRVIIEEPLVVGDLTFKYFVHVMPFENIRPYFGTLGIKPNCYISLLEDNGEIIFNLNGNVNENFFDFLLKYDTNKNSLINDIVYEIDNNIDGCKRIRLEEHNCYILYKQLYEWELIIICPVGFLYTEQYNYTPLIRAFFAILSGVIFFSSIALAHILVRYGRDRKLYVYQNEVNTELKVAVNEANKANAAKSDFLSRISHDIRTPMNGIMGMTHIAKTNIDNKEKVTYCLNKIDQASDHLLTLLNNVLDLSKIESGVIQLKYSPVNMEELLKTCENMLVAQSQNMLLNLETKYDLKHEYIMIDEVRLKQVLINILSNAVKFNNYGGSITFSAVEEKLDASKSKYVFKVEDSGVGMSQEFIDKIYEPFVQEDETDARTEYKGSGLGMSIVKELVDLMGGKIEIESKLGVGTKITIILEAEFLKDEKELEAKLVEYERLEGMKILLAEDNEINMEIAEALLEEVGVNVTKAVNGQEAIDLFKESPVNYYHAILMDVLMPVKNGYEASMEIRNLNRPDSQSIPIIAMTANAYNEDKEKAYQSGMDAHVIKPIQIEKLYDALLRYKK